MANIDKRLSDLEKALEPDGPVEIRVGWIDEDGRIEDRESGEWVSEAEWRKRHPTQQLIMVRWNDGNDDEED